MNWIWWREADEILSVGRSLEDAGVRNWALDPAQAVLAVEELAAEEIAILGGDVYGFRNGSLRPNGDGWYCEREASEQWEPFVERSAKKARAYVEDYCGGNVSEVWFAIVPGGDL